MSQTWEYNGNTFEVKMGNVAFVEKYNNAFEKLKDNPVGATGRAIDRIKDTCRSIWGLFDDIYGEGTADKLFEGEMDIDSCYDAMDALIGAAHEDVKRSSTKASNIASKYAPKRRK